MDAPSLAPNPEKPRLKKISLSMKRGIEEEGGKLHSQISVKHPEGPTEIDFGQELSVIENVFVKAPAEEVMINPASQDGKQWHHDINKVEAFGEKLKEVEKKPEEKEPETRAPNAFVQLDKTIKDMVDEHKDPKVSESLSGIQKTVTGLHRAYTLLDDIKAPIITVATNDRAVELKKVPEVLEKVAFTNADRMTQQINQIAKDQGPEAAKAVYDALDHKREKDGFLFNNMQKSKDFLPVRIQRENDWKSRLGAMAYSVSKASLATTEILAVNSVVSFLNAVDALSGGAHMQPLHTKSVIAKEMNNVFGVVTQRDFWRGVSYSEAIFYNALEIDPKNPAKRKPEWNDRRVMMLEEFAKRAEEFERLLDQDRANKQRWSASDIHRYKMYEEPVHDFKKDFRDMSSNSEDQRYIERVMKTYQENPALRRILKNTILGTPIRERLAAVTMGDHQQTKEMAQAA